MRKAIVGGVVAALMTGCNFSPVRRCTTDGDCGVGGDCDEGLKICIDQSGSGGGSGGGCPTACPAYEECVDRVCQPRYAGVEVLSPANGAVVSDPVVVRARLVLHVGRTHYPPGSCELTGSSSAGAFGPVELPQADAGSAIYEGTFSPPAEGTLELRVGYPGTTLTSERVVVTVDRTRPAFQVTVPAPGRPSEPSFRHGDPDAGFASAWRRDEVAPIQISTAEPHLDESRVALTLSGVGGAPVTWPVRNWSPCDAGRCARVDVELWRPEMRAVRARLPISVTGFDLAGNEGQGQATIPVTRWKWTFEAPGMVLHMPAIGPDGTVYTGGEGSSGRGLFAIAPSGRLVWSRTDAGVSTSPALGMGPTGLVLFAGGRSGAGTSLYALDPSDGTLLGECAFSGGVSGTLAVVPTRYGTEASASLSAVALVNDPNPPLMGHLLALRPFASQQINRCLSHNPQLPWMTPGGGISARGSELYFGTNGGTGGADGRGHGWRFGPSGFEPLDGGWPVDLGAHVGTPAVSDDRIVFSGGSLSRTVAAVRFDGTLAWREHALGESRASNPVVVGEQAVFGDQSQNVHRRWMSDGGSAGATATGSQIFTAPAAGEGGYTFVVTSTGLLVYDRQSSLAWSEQDLGRSDYSSPALDCAREPDGGIADRPGVIYFGADGKLHALVVDSRGLDVTARWPKLQRDPWNTANAQAPLAPFACRPDGGS